MQLDLTNCQLKFGFFPPVKGVGVGGQFSSKIDTKENMFAWMDQRMTQSVLLFGPDFSVLVTTVETDITLLHYIFFKHSWV